MLDLYEELRAITRALGRARIPYALADGLAVGVYTAPRATEDLDLLLAEDRITRRILSERVRRGACGSARWRGSRRSKVAGARLKTAPTSTRSRGGGARQRGRARGS